MIFLPRIDLAFVDKLTIRSFLNFSYKPFRFIENIAKLVKAKLISKHHSTRLGKKQSSFRNVFPLTPQRITFLKHAITLRTSFPCNPSLLTINYAKLIPTNRIPTRKTSEDQQSCCSTIFVTRA